MQCFWQRVCRRVDDPVVRYLLPEDASHKTKVILMTDPEQQTDDYRALTKPFNNEQLVAQLRSKANLSLIRSWLLDQVPRGDV